VKSTVADRIRGSARGLALLALLVAASACSATASGSTQPEGGEPTTTQAAESTTTSAGDSTTSSSSTTTAPTTTTTTLVPIGPTTFASIEKINTIREFSGYTSRGLTRWSSSVPGIEDIRIASTATGSEQPALWLAPTGEQDRPLLVILHSWSSSYLQHAGIPYAMWAQENGWAVIAPEFRGINNKPEAVGSELAVQDVVDAIDFAVAQEGVDADRVFAVGYSGGGMMAMLLAGRHPDKVTAVAAWGPAYDLIAFYAQSRAAGRHYAGDIWRACGGDPRVTGPAEEECLRRSPMTYLDTARDEAVPVYIGQGIWDSFVSTEQGARAYNQLADPEDRLTDEQIDEIRRRRIPEPSGLDTTETFFGDGDPTPLFARQSAAVWLVFFRADHEMVYQAALRWFASDPR